MALCHFGAQRRPAYITGPCEWYYFEDDYWRCRLCSGNPWITSSDHINSKAHVKKVEWAADEYGVSVAQLLSMKSLQELGGNGAVPLKDSGNEKFAKD